MLKHRRFCVQPSCSSIYDAHTAPTPHQSRENLQLMSSLLSGHLSAYTAICSLRAKNQGCHGSQWSCTSLHLAPACSTPSEEQFPITGTAMRLIARKLGGEGDKRLPSFQYSPSLHCAPLKADTETHSAYSEQILNRGTCCRPQEKPAPAQTC